MKVFLQFVFIWLLVVFIMSCNSNKLKVNISDIEKKIEIIRFDEELFALPLQDTLKELLGLHQQNPDFFNLFTYKIIRVGGIDDKNFAKMFSGFLADTMIQDVKLLVDKEFSDFSNLYKPLTKAFKYFQYHFPEKELPTIYTYISGFNQSVVTAENIIGISLDKYLGTDCPYYQQLSDTPQYKIRNMHKKKIISDVAYAWGITEFEETNRATNMLGNMVHQGKLMYFVDAMVPTMHDTLKIGYTKKQLDWCKANEPQMWMKLIETKMLYSSKRMDIIRYTNDGPHTNGFPLESPARTGVWIGWQIVRQYMDKHPDVTLSELMQNTDYQNILNNSGYFPE